MEKNYTLQNAMEEFDYQIDKFLEMKETDAEYKATVDKIKDLQKTIAAELEKIVGKESVYKDARFGTTAEDRERIEKNSEK